MSTRGAPARASTSTQRLLEEAADAARQALALAEDDGVGAELLADLRQQLLEAAAAEGLDAGLGASGAVAAGTVALMRRRTPMVSTRMPGAISL